METFTVGQHDHGVPMKSSLVDGDGAPVNLSGASVHLAVSAGVGYPRIVDAQAVVEDAANGAVSYTWTSTDTQTPGNYIASWEVTFADGSLESFPNDSYITVNITPDV